MRNHNRFAVLVAGILALSRVFAGDGTPLFDYRETTLDNGLRIVTLEDFSCPIVAVHLWYHVGSKDEQPDRQGFAHMFEHMMFRGTDTLGPTDHFDYVRRTGGDCNAYTAFDNTTYIQTLPSNQLELALYLESERMAFLKIDQGSFDTERKVVEEERRLGLNQPYGTVFEKLFGELFTVHPYHWTPIGQIPHLRAASVAELRAFWTKFYVPNNATLVIVGAVKHADAQDLARKYFGWIPRYPDVPRVAVREPALAAAKTITIKEDSAPAPVVGVVFRSVPVGHPDYVPLELLATILGGGESSRLYRELVAQKQLAVVAVAGAFSMEQDGLVGAVAALTPFSNNGKKVTARIKKQIAKLRDELVTEEELTKARNQMLKGIVTQNLTVASKASALGSAAVLEGNTANVNKRLAAIEAVTREDLKRVATTYLAPERMYTVTIEQNLMGSLFGKKKDEEAPITATAETDPPPPGRANVTRPNGWPAAPPVAPPLKSINTPNFSSRKLDNGMKVMVVPNDEIPFVSVTLGLVNGAYTETKVGAANAALDMLTKGTAQHDEGALARDLETYAIDLGGSADIDSASVRANCLSDQLPKAVAYLSEVVQSATFPAEEFEKLRKQARTGMVVQQSQPTYIADRELRQHMFGSHPYSRTAAGEPEDLDKLTADDAKSWWKSYARPDQSVLIFSGNVDAEAAFKLAQDSFGGWKAEGPAPHVELPPIPEGNPTHIYIVNRPGAVQSEIRVGQVSITRQSPQYATSKVVSDYFGGAFSSRLNEKIRVEKGLTYGAGGGYSASRFAGKFTIHTFSKTDTTGEAVRAVFDEVTRLRAEAPTDDELSKTKSSFAGKYPGERETPQAVARDLWQIELEGLPADYFEKLLAGVSSTSANDCKTLIDNTIDPARMVVVVVGDADKIRGQLEGIAPVTVVTPAVEQKPTTPEAKTGDDED